MKYSLQRLLIAGIVLVIIGIPFNLHAQNQEESGILWRITGKDNAAVSYLFGTMHLKDKKLFNFPDSLYAALEQTDGFAIEVHPDSLVEAVLKRKSGSPLLSEILKPAAFNRIKKKLEKEFRVKPETITLEQLETYCRERYYRIEAENSMNTFMDTYLYGAAARLGKWTGGVEDVADQINLLEDSDPASTVNEFMENDANIRSGIDSMINVYLAGHTDLMAAMASNDLNMIARNKKMAVRMDSLMKIRTMTFAVGAAHLSGEEGVVDLLRRRGYTVELVDVSKRTFVLDHPFRFKEIAWVDVKDSKNLYSVQMPGVPMKGLEIPGTEMQLYVDMKSGVSYFVFAVAGKNDFTFDSTYTKFLDIIDPDLEVKDYKVVHKGEVEGREVTAASSKNVIRLQLFHTEGIVYAAYINYFPTALVAAVDIERFFTSFEISKPSKEYLEESRPRIFESRVAGVKLWLPSNPVMEKEDAGNGGNLYQYTAVDYRNDLGYMVMVTLLEPGKIFSDDSVQLAAYANNIRNNGKYKFISEKRETLQGFPANRLDFTLKAREDASYYRTLNVIRGRRNYFFMVYGHDKISLEKHSPDFFNSIEFLIPPSENWREQAVPGESFTLFAPEAIQRENDSTGTGTNELKWISGDSLSGVSFSIIKKPHSPYMQVSSDTSFLRDALGIYSAYDRELLSFGFKSNGGLPAAEQYSKYLNSHTIQRIRCVLSSECLVYLFASGEKKVVESDEVTKMMDSFHPGGSGDLSRLFEPKTDTILKAVTSPDPIISEHETLLAFQATRFTEKDLPKLYEALKVKYRENLNSVPGLIIWAILQVHDPSSIEDMRNVYLQLAPGSKVRSEILNFFADWKSVEAHKIATGLFLNHRPHAKSFFPFLIRFCDSIELATPYFHQLMPLVKDSGMAAPILNFAKRMLGSKQVKPSELLPYKAVLVELAEKVASVKPSMPDTDIDYYDDLCHILGAIGDPVSVAALRKMLSNPDAEIKIEVIRSLIGLKQPLPAADLLKIAADRTLRTDLYDTLAGAGKQAVFPKQYLTQRAFGEAELYNYYLSEDGDDVKRIDFVGERTVRYKNKMVKVLLYKVTFNYDTPESYLGVAGPYALTPAGAIKSNGELTGMLYDQQYNAARLDTDLKAFVKQTEKEEQE